ncbi:MAG TPA: hypothetical protein VGR48_10460, partial [Terriglobales bacterium]|nr:hypothetical protein [Terriglobales bacterium]
VVMRLAVQPLWVCRLSAVPFGSYLRTAGSALGRALLAAASAWLLCGWAIRPDYWSLAGSAAAALCVYGLAVLFLVFSNAERQRVWAAVAPLARIFRPQPLPAMTRQAP